MNEGLRRRTAQLLIVFLLLSYIAIEVVAFAATSWQPQLKPTIIIPRQEWGAAPPYNMDLRDRTKGMGLIFHHTAHYFPELDYFKTAEEIKRVQDQHMNTEGYGDIGYHYIVDRAGRIWDGRSTNWTGAHSKGNNHNIGIVALGNYEGAWGIGAQNVTTGAFQAMERLSKWLVYQESLDDPFVYTHRQFNDTVCPGGNMNSLILLDLRLSIRNAMQPAVR